LHALVAADTANAGTRGTALVTVQPAAASACATTQAPGSAVAGSVIGLGVTLRDAFNNVATGYAGTIALTATDPRASLPASVKYVPASDAGSHAFSAVLLTTGAQTLTATDVADATITCAAAVTVTHAAPRIALTLPADANSGYAVNVGVAVKDLFDNAIRDYAGTVTFASTDSGAGAAKPADIVFTGAENGTATASATFVTLGTQTLSASDSGTPQAAGSAFTAVHGLVYTNPAGGRVALVLNAAQSNTQTVQLELVANERLEMYNCGSTASRLPCGPGSFSAGMNLPIDTAKVAAGAPLFTAGSALAAGAGTPAQKGTINNEVLYTAVSKKRVATTGVLSSGTRCHPARRSIPSGSSSSRPPAGA